jgi:hypothetical protein
MPLFYSNIRRDGDYVEDLEGEEFADIEVAKANAEESILILMAEQVKSKSLVEVRAIEICDAQRQVLAVVSLPDILPEVIPSSVLKEASS